LRVPLLERREGEGPVCSRAHALVADGLLAHQRRAGGEDLLLLLVLVAPGRRLLLGGLRSRLERGS